MSHEIFSRSWAEAWAEELRDSSSFRRAAASWEGSILLRMEGDAESGPSGEQAVLLDLAPGDCREARPASAEDRRRATYVIVSTAASWLGLLQGDLDPLLALMSGRLRLERGSLARLAGHVQVARQLIAAARRVDSHLPGEAPEPGRATAATRVDEEVPEAD